MRGCNIGGTIDQAPETEYLPITGVVHQLDGALLPGFKTHCGPGGNVQAHAVGHAPVKTQCAIGFSKMVVRADLDRAIGCVVHHQRHTTAAWVEHMAALINQKFTWNHECLNLEIKQQVGAQ